jgi:tRNA acetyltransferase TAN1
MAKPVIRLFNLIVSHYPGLREARRTVSVVKSVVRGARVIDTPHSLVLFKVEDPFEAVTRIVERVDLEQTPILRLIPVDANTRPYVSHVRSAVAWLADKIPEGASFAIRLEGRLLDDSGNPLHKLDAVKLIAEVVDRPVNLRSPDYLVLVKTVSLSYGQRYAAIMVAPPSYVVSVHKLHRA